MKKLIFTFIVLYFLLFISQLSAVEKNVPTFKHPNITQDLKCNLFFDNSSPDSQIYIEDYKINRLTFNDSDDLPMDCESIRARHYFPNKSLSREEADFPFARVRIVYRDYTLIEMDLASSYAPQNQYCYSIDRNSNDVFRSQIHALAKCFPNVQVAEMEYELDSSGKNMYYSMLECFRLLERREWKYVQLLQNHDINLRTNRESVQIFKWLNNSNDVGQGPIKDNRIEKYPGWKFSDLHLFRNDSRNTMTFNGHKPEIVISKSLFQASLTRAFFNFIMYDLNVMPLIGRLEERLNYGADELLFPILNTMDAVAATGGTTQHCRKSLEYITRYSLWGSKDCKIRHGICVFGAEHLLPVIDTLPHLFANKMMPEYDFGAIACWYERLFNKTYVEEPKALNESFYKSLVSVRLQKLKNKDGLIELESLKLIEECDFDPNL